MQERSHIVIRVWSFIILLIHIVIRPQQSRTCGLVAMVRMAIGHGLPVGLMPLWRLSACSWAASVHCRGGPWACRQLRQLLRLQQAQTLSQQ